MSTRSKARPALEGQARADLLTALQAGNTREAAARYVRLTPAELMVLMGRDPELERDVLAAEANVEVAAIAGMAKAAKGGDWRAGVELLERRPPAPSTKCPGTNKKTRKPCGNIRGFRTDHPGFGPCNYHGGATRTGKKGAAKEAAAAAVVKLGLPLGSGDPFELLEAATKYSQGYLEATAQLLVAVVDGARTDIALEQAARLHVDAIRQGATTGHQAVTADVADRQAKISDRMATVVVAAIQAGLDAAGVTGEARSLAEAAAADILEVSVPTGAGLN